MRGEGDRRIPPPALVEQAKAFPNGWVYEIVGVFSPEEAIPPEAIRGAWEVDGAGNLTGKFEPNAKFQAR